jgi:hypothetical protein
VTSEQAIILGLLAAAFIAGWVVRATTGHAPRDEDWQEPPRAQVTPPPEAASAPPFEAEADPTAAVAVHPPSTSVSSAASNGIGAVLDESRLALDRAITDYHATVALLLRDGEGSSTSDTMFERFGTDVVRLAEAVEDASDELAGDPLCDHLRASGSALRHLAGEVLVCSRQAKPPPPEILDRSEERLISTAAAISVRAAA